MPMRAEQRGTTPSNIMRETLPDLVLVDWMLPGASGVELAGASRPTERTRTVPIIMLTARSDGARTS